MIKKLFTLLIFGLFSSSTVIQAQNVDLFLDEATVAPGNDVTLELTTENFTDIFVLEFVLQWDSTVLEYVSHQDFHSDMDFESVHFATPEGIGRADVFKIAWNDSKVKGVDLPDGAVIFSITFKAIGNAGDSSPVEFTIGPPPFSEWEIVQDFRSYTHQEIEDAVHDGKVTIDDDGGGTLSVDLIGSHETVSSGETACVDVSVKNFEQIKSMDVVMRYDEDVIKFEEIQNINLPQLTQGNFTNPEPGQVRMSYNNPTGATVTDNTTIFEVCYEAVGNNGTSSAFRFTGGDPNPPLEVVNINDESLDVRTSNGSVNVGGEGGDLYFKIDDYKVNSQSICVPVRVSGFKNMVGYTQSISFDADYMSFEEINNFAFDNLGLGINDNHIDDGKIGILWATADGEAKTLSDESVIMELCFTLNDGCGSGTTISFSDDPVVRELYEEPNLEVFPEYLSGTLSCEGKAVSETVTNVSCDGDCDGEIALDIKGWDVDKIEWSDPDLPDKAHVEGLCAGTYSVTVSYTDNTDIVKENIEVGVDQGPSVTLVEIHPDLGGSEGSIVIETNPNHGFEWSNGDNNMTAEGLSTGTYSVTVTSENGCSTVLENLVVLIVKPAISDATCSDSEDGEISVDIGGGSGNYTYEWSCSDDTGSSISALPAGDCTLTITDEDGDFTNVVTLTVGAPPAIEISDIITSPDDGSGNGSIDITVEGGVEPYTFNWQPGGQTSQNISGLENGAYILKITDANGCTYTSDPIILGDGGPTVIIGSSMDEYSGYGVSCSGECNGYIDMLTFEIDNPSIEWDDGNTDFSRFDLCPGDYAYTITSGGETIQEGTVSLEEPETLEIGEIDVNCSDGSNGSADVKVEGGAEPYAYSWDNGDNYDEESTVAGLAPGRYEVYVLDANGCETQSDYRVIQCEEPDADCFTGRKIITPNGDGKNDELTIKYCGQIQSANIDIYTEWGELVYQENDYRNDWDGRSRSGDHLADGLYHWVLRVVLSTGEIQTHRGSVNLVRTMN